jgi:phosphatidylglycerol---prolipoprotein diacylglyceryl transferase
MTNFWSFYQHIPEHLKPTAVSVGFFSVSWYSLMYFAGFVVVYLLLGYRVNKSESDNLVVQNLHDCWKAEKLKIQDCNSKLKNLIVDMLAYAFLGLLIGARLGYVLFYDFEYYLTNPLAIISPFSATGSFIGIYGMSYHGGLIGVIIATIIFCRKKKINFWDLSDFIIPAVPAGYFFGRIGNFVNGELYGRTTDKIWGMYFPDDPTFHLRHPSQLYEAMFEGAVLFIVLWALRNSKKMTGKFLWLYMAGYAICRIVSEFFRQPDGQIGYIFMYFTLGQVLSLFMLVISLYKLFFQMTKKVL